MNPYARHIPHDRLTRARLYLSALTLAVLGLSGGRTTVAHGAGGRRTGKTIGQHVRGALVISGGGDVPAVVRTRFYELAGGAKARIVVIPTANPDDDAQHLAGCLGPWRRFPTTSLAMLHTRDRAVANTHAFTELLAQATGVWISGGYQERLSEVYAGTETERQLLALLDRGGVIGGTSAGAAIMTRIMIADGREKAVLGTGFNLLEGAVVDQHFMTRNRIGRLLGVLTEHPDLVGFGIDEDTAMVVNLRDHRLRIFGNSYVVACLPDPSIRHARIEFLKPGDEIDLSTLIPAVEPTVAAASQIAR